MGRGTSGGILTTAKRKGDSWILNGQKKWMATLHGATSPLIWARDVANNQVKALIVENKTTPGFKVETIQNKIALKVVQNGLITMENRRSTNTSITRNASLLDRMKIPVIHGRVACCSVVVSSPEGSIMAARNSSAS